jgi:hypothetical protein
LTQGLGSLYQPELGMESPIFAERLMTPTAEIAVGVVSEPRRKAGFLWPALYAKSATVGSDIIHGSRA